MADIERVLVPPEDVQAVHEKSNHCMAVSYCSVAFNIWQCKEHDNEFLVDMEALGNSLSLFYYINLPHLALEDLLKIAHKDFCSYVVQVRATEHDTLH